MEALDVLAVSEANRVVSATPIRAGGAESANMSLSDRERPKGFHHTASSAVASPASERFEGFQGEITTAITRSRPRKPGIPTLNPTDTTDRTTQDRYAKPRKETTRTP